MSGHDGRVRIERLPITHPDAVALIEDVQAYYASIYGSPDETPLEPGYFEPPQGAFFIGYDGEVPVATGAWRMRPDVAEELGLERPAEIKRMYVAAPSRGRGLAREMLVHLEATALAEGATAMILETGAPQTDAIRLYVAAGYEPIAPFGHYRCAPEVRCFGHAL